MTFVVGKRSTQQRANEVQEREFFCPLVSVFKSLPEIFFINPGYNVLHAHEQVTKGGDRSECQGHRRVLLKLTLLDF